MVPARQPLATQYYRKCLVAENSSMPTKLLEASLPSIPRVLPSKPVD